MMFNQRTSILKGPSREGLFDSLRLGLEVDLHLEDKANYMVKATIWSLKPEDGSRLRWLVEVNIKVDGKIVTVSGYYDTETRKGYLNFK